MFSEVVTGLKFSVDCKNLISVGGDGYVTVVQHDALKIFLERIK